MEMFASRVAAAELLASALAVYRGQNALVLAIPRGAVPMGAVIAARLHGELDVVLVRKLRAPGNPELAIGAVDETGWAYIAPHARRVGAGPEYLEEEQRAQLAVLRKRRAEYTPGRAPIDATGRVVIVVDDGLATGATMIAALHAARAKRPATLVCAVPVAAAESAAQVRAYADQLVCLETPEAFYAVGQFYQDFRQVDDSEVIALLAKQTEVGAGHT
jgi:putative phosphoribosyl transferase